ncbi:serine/threonine protein kinase with TPR repeats [Alteromonadaceae bacterium 2753L.S.0a.02]|nr:serine/threonine protein kinase with TPR repeats [Alteromonadaceae bacterium 2753L.S.0a.02]
MNQTDEITLARQSLDIFDDAIEQPEKSRLEYIRKRCGDNKALFDKCAALLAHYRSDESFFGSDTITKFSAKPQAVDLIGENFGVYRLNKKLGGGGMGDVYAATRTDGIHNFPVALKLIRGWGDTRELISRFERERAILSGLKHPNIAHFLDGGISIDGRPWYAMEYVDGLNLDTYCQQNSLSIEERLRLFINVCEAVASAHKQLVIHRDLKFSNIMVTYSGQVKLLDFGVAKLLQEEKEDTTLSVLGAPMTPRYSSPEQIKHEALTTASDQFSLGVILYELITGQSPYDLKSENLLKAVCEIQPKRPSQVFRNTIWNAHIPDRKIAFDLDEIILKSLQKDPERRYASVQQFADDIARYLAKRPVMARKESLFYLSLRFVQRNRVLAGLLATLLLVAAGQQLRVINERNIAQHERDLAEQAREKAEQNVEVAHEIQNFMLGLFSISDPGESRGNTVTAREILDRGVEKIEASLNKQPEYKSALLNSMGVVYRELGLYSASEPLLQEALELRQESLPTSKKEAIESLTEYGDLLNEQGRYQEAEAHFHDALALSSSGEGDVISDNPNIYVKLGKTEFNQGNYETAIENYQKALLSNSNSAEKDDLLIAEIFNNIAVVYNETGNYDLAIEFCNKALAIQLNTFGEHHPDVAKNYHNLGFAYASKGEYDKAIDYYEKSLSLNLQFLGPNHAYVARTYNNLGIVYREQNQLEMAINNLSKGLEINKAVLGEQHPLVGGGYNNLGTIYVDLGQYQKAIDYYNQSLAVVINALGDKHLYVAGIYANLSGSYFNLGDYPRAISYAEQSLAILSDTVEPNHPLYAEVYETLGQVHAELKDYRLALEYYQKSLDIAVKVMGPDHPDTQAAKANLMKITELANGN